MSYDKFENNFIELFNFEKKSQLIKYCKSALFTMEYFVKIIELCDTNILPYTHNVKFTLYVPPNLKPTIEEFRQFEKNGKAANSTFIRKITAIGKNQRRNMVKHLFFLPDQSKWHFIYFEQRDLDEGDNSWVGGKHIHFLNYLWPSYSFHSLWSQFCKDKVKFSGSLHLATEGWD